MAKRLTSSSMEFSDRTLNRFQWVMNFEAFQAKRNFAGVLSRQAHKSGDLVVEAPIRMRYASSAPVVAASITGPSPISCNCSRSK